VYNERSSEYPNALKHAGAKLISLSFGMRGDFIFVIIRDDGCGFDPKEIKGNGIGLASMCERSNLISANLDITPQIGVGTIITLKIPLRKSIRR
jgi:two-component system sensor histidine kinase DegS